jgi:hypothetical protein
MLKLGMLVGNYPYINIIGLFAGGVHQTMYLA